ncbi:hypothetical protein IP91_01251 [Pseudoduganella lurida]|uniref:PEP-CTERM sorting domain-containing protein n=1 Tax=Pseudoduganella lurida TaxID=1036180 RepID=A0A562RMA9_9BURK|nr:hypothetical protein [Pseudoduganella lurida]TWI70171.1 hypothetical protein IP91_01251 [Pseudoduganella lurida]
MRSLFISLPAICGILSGTVNGAPVQSSFAADAFSSTYDCRYRADTGKCALYPGAITPNGTSTRWPTGASSSAADARGQAWSLATADAASYLPELKAYASSAADYVNPSGGTSMADANVWAVQGYRYTGATPFTLTVTARLDAVFSGAAGNHADNHSLLAVSLFDTDGYTFDYDPARPGGGTCPITGMMASPNPGCAHTPEVFAHHDEFLRDSGAITVTLSYLLKPGQAFYVGAYVDANVCCGGIVDSSNTLTMQFNDASLLVDYPVTLVPEAQTWLMLLGGLTVLAWSRHRPVLASICRHHQPGRAS